MRAKMKSRYLALALGAALIAAPASMAAAYEDGDGTDGYSASEGQTGETSDHDAYSSDDTPAATPVSDDDVSHDMHSDSDGSDPEDIPCSLTDPCSSDDP